MEAAGGQEGRLRSVVLMLLLCDPALRFVSSDARSAIPLADLQYPQSALSPQPLI